LNCLLNWKAYAMPDIFLFAVLLIVLVIGLSLLAFQVITGVPPMSANSAEAADIIALLKQAKLSEQAIVYELGCGWGMLVVALARAFPDAQIRGIEMSPFPYWIGRLRTRNMPNVFLQRGNFYNSDLGQGIKNQALNMGKDYVANKLGQSQNPYLQTLGQGVNAAGDAYLSGQSPREALGQGVGAAGQQFGGGIGGAMQNLGQSIGQGHSPSQALQNTARGGYEGIGGMQGIQNMGMDALNNFRSGQAPGQALQNVARNTWEQHRPRRQTPGFINMEGEMPGMEAMNYG